MFTACTARCTRRAWDLFLRYGDDIEQFTTKTVRGKLTAATAKAAEAFAQTLTTEGGATEVRTNGADTEFTGTLAAVQLVLKQPEARMFDATWVE